MQFVYCTEVSLFCDITPQNTDAVVPPWHELRHSIMVEIRLLHLQPFTNGHFHFLIIAELVTLHAWLWQSKKMICCEM
jgi:hypothetical protein